MELGEFSLRVSAFRKFAVLYRSPRNLKLTGSGRDERRLYSRRALLENFRAISARRAAFGSASERTEIARNFYTQLSFARARHVTLRARLGQVKV